MWARLAFSKASRQFPTLFSPALPVKTRVYAQGQGQMRLYEAKLANIIIAQLKRAALTMVSQSTFELSVYFDGQGRLAVRRVCVKIELTRPSRAGKHHTH